MTKKLTTPSGLTLEQKNFLRKQYYGLKRQKERLLYHVPLPKSAAVRKAQVVIRRYEREKGLVEERVAKKFRVVFAAAEEAFVFGSEKEIRKALVAVKALKL